MTDEMDTIYSKGADVSTAEREPVDVLAEALLAASYRDVYDPLGEGAEYAKAASSSHAVGILAELRARGWAVTWNGVPDTQLAEAFDAARAVISAGYTKDGLDKDRWRRAQERVIATTSYDPTHVRRLSNAVAAEYAKVKP